MAADGMVAEVGDGQQPEEQDEESHIYFGPLDEEAKVLMQRTGPSQLEVEGMELERMEASKETEDLVAKHAAEIKELEISHKAKRVMTAAPTIDSEVKAYLRSLREPQTLFGEDNYSRRERLKRLLVQREQEGVKAPVVVEVEAKEEEGEQKELFFTEGSAELHKARRDIALFSIPRAISRNSEQRQRWNIDPIEEEEIQETFTDLIQAKFHVEASQVGDDRPLSSVRFSPDTSMVSTTSWNGMLRIWNTDAARRLSSTTATNERLNFSSWSPTLISNAHALATAAADGIVKVYKVVDDGARLELLQTFEGHEDRANRTVFHPSGKYLFTSSHDATWRMWDVETGVELLLQEGHSMPVFALACHPDGSLLMSGDTGAVGRVWDLRTGRTVMVLQSHVKQILSADFHPCNGYQLASCSDDNSIRVWDLRQQRCAEHILAHTKLVSDVCFEPEKGRVLVSAGYDKIVKVWCAKRWNCVRNLLGHDSLVTGVNCARRADDLVVASVGFDRTLKLWSTIRPSV